MIHSLRSRVRFRSWLHPACLAALLCAAFTLLPVARAQGTRLWTQAQLEDFEHGTPEGVALTSDGHLLRGPSLTSLLTTPSTFVWSIAVDKDGVAYLGTSSPASVLRVGPEGKAFTLFSTHDLSVQVVRLGPDGALYVATMPGGRVYKLNPGASNTLSESDATLVFDLARIEAASTGAKASEAGGGDPASAEKSDANPHYIWDLAFDRAGRLYVATGAPGAVYRVDTSKPGSTPELFFKSDEAHIRALAWDAHGNLIAGSDGTGLVYRISPEGKGYVLYEAPRREITSIAVAPDGSIYAACVGDKNRNPLPPLPVQSIGTATITIVMPESLQATHPSASVPEGTEIDILAENQTPRKLWEDKSAIVYALALRPDGLLALSGNRGRVFRITPDGSYADIAHLDAEQGLSLAVTSDSVLIGTGNTGKLVRLNSGGDAGTHAYSSDVLDAGVMARFGRIEVEPGSSGYALFTRTGNIEQPIRGWSDWQPLDDGSVASPAGRFLQWKAVLKSGGVLGSVGVNYLPINIAPVVDDIVIAPGARVASNGESSTEAQSVSISFGASNSTTPTTTYDASAGNPLQASKDPSAITVRWTAHDDNGDSLVYSLYLRGDGESIWRLLKNNITEKAWSFNADQIPDGGYQVKVVASDAPSHTPADALTSFKISSRFVIDTTPPVIHDLKAAGALIHCDGSACTAPFTITFSATDAISPITRAQYSVDAGEWQYLEPIGKLSDAETERYELPLSLAAPDSRLAEHLITVRVFDRYDNVAVAKTVIPAEEK